MKMLLRLVLSLVFPLALGLHARLGTADGGQIQGLPHPPKAFRVLDGTLYEPKPDLSSFGIEKADVIYEWALWGGDRSSQALPVRRRVEEAAHKVTKQGVIIIDIERYPMRGHSEEVMESIRKYRTVVQWVKGEAPHAVVGLYGQPPVHDYFRSLTGEGHEEYLSWQRENDQLLPLAADVDVILPSLYTFRSDEEDWIKYAVSQIREARRYGKPVYAFLWPRYHSSNRILGLQYISREFWGLQLRTAYSHADGIVLWGGWDFKKKRPQQWDSDAPWWLETKRFMAEIKGYEQ